MFNINKPALDWLQCLLQERLHSDVLLDVKNKAEKEFWELRCVGSSSSITLPLIPLFYHLGPQLELPCAQWIPSAEGFSALEPQLAAPALAVIPKPLVVARDHGFHLFYDILGLTYWMLARCEEVDPQAELLDNHDRFPATSSHAFRHGYLERPIVDEWIGILRQVIARLWPRLPLVQPQFQVCVSHDVDAPSAYAFVRKRTLCRAMAANLLKRRDLPMVVSAPWIRLKTKHRLHPRDPFNTFDWLMDVSEAARIRSAFYFICGRTNPILDAQYEPEHPTIRHLMRRIHERGHEIGLHPSYNTCARPERIGREGQRLKRICQEEGIHQSQWGGRMHYLRWQWPATALGWQNAGYDYDSTLGYADYPGFRCGTSHPYKMFDPVGQYQLKLVQKPLIIMECTVIDKRYLGLGYCDAALDLMFKLKRQCRAVSGCFSLLWHNNHLSNQKAKDIYCDLLSN